MTQQTLIDGPTAWIKRNGRARRVQVNERGLERQQYLLRAEAVDLGEGEIARLTDDEAYTIFEHYRFSERDGVPFCPYCQTENAYRLTINRRTKDGVVPTKIYKCRFQKGDKEREPCGRQFSVTSGTEFHSRKMPIRDILYGLIVFANAASGEAALRLRRSLRRSYKTAFVMEGKLREAIHRSRNKRRLCGVVEVDGTEVGGHYRKAPLKLKGREQPGGPPSMKKVMLGLRERHPEGESRIGIFKHELHYRDPVADTDFIRDNVVRGSNMVSDEGFELGYIGPHDRVKHKDGYKIGNVHNNGIEGLFARVKRAENGVYYGWGSKDDYLELYGAEICWREDHRRLSNGDHWRMLVAAVSQRFPARSTAEATMKKPADFQRSMWRGYWQRWQTDNPAIRRRHTPEQRAKRARRGARLIAAWEAEGRVT